MNRSIRTSFRAVLATALAAACSGRESGTVRREASSPDTAVAARTGASSTSYIGLRYDSLPADVKFEGGAVIPARVNGPLADYDFTHVRTLRGDMIWLDTIGAPVGRGLRARIVRGELTIPPLAPDERLFMASCDIGGRFDGHIVAIVVSEPNVSRFTKVRQAWRANPVSGRFDIIPVRGVVCEEPGSG
jgi:hypothetical protein